LTLIAWNVTDDYAELLTDTLTYSVGEAEFTQVSKVSVFPHIDMAVAGKGAAEFSLNWKSSLDLFAEQVAGGIDAVRNLADIILPEMWHGLERCEGTRSAGMVWNVGWSTAQGRFVAHEFFIDNDTDLSCTDRTGFGSSPALAAPPAAAPVTDDDWIQFAEDVYAEHAVAIRPTYDRTMIGGDLVLTRMERGTVTQRRIHTLPNDDRRWRQMMIGTVHRDGQIGPCVCGCGQPYIVCQFSASFSPDYPCPCETGPAFADCHRVDPTDIAVLLEIRSRQQEYWDTQDELRARWIKAFPENPNPVPMLQIVPPRPPDYKPVPAPVPRPLPVVRSQSRNEPCSCGSGRKYKRCCAAADVGRGSAA
jgi:hypothetical protein